jgi:uncharacterized membrane protein
MAEGRGLFAHVRDRFVGGLLLVLPLLITVWLLDILFGVVHDNVTPLVFSVLRAIGLGGLEGWHARLTVPLIGVLLTFLVVYLIGLLGANLLGRRVVTAVESWILRVPFVRSIYGGARQLLDAFNATKSGGFSRVVMVEYPRRGIWTMGFVTNERPGRGGAAREVFVFLPTTPNPTSGWLALIPADQIVDLDLTVEEGIKLIVSGGIVLPPGIVGRDLPSPGGHDPDVP